MADSTKWVWVPDNKHVFTKALILSESESLMTVRVESTGQTREIDASSAEKMNPPQFDEACDMAELTYLNEPSVVSNLSTRWLNDKIYTYSGLFLVAVNPYKHLQIYDEQAIQQYKGRKREDTEPHIYAVAEQAFRSMQSSLQDQSILITGESGAGKTENTKKAIQYLSCVTSSGGSKSAKDGPGVGIDKRILQTNPILEAFGNAQTIRNANSSRFGKFIKIQFSSSAAKGNYSSMLITGASIQWYLLEKSRVVTQHSSERNYHVFYQLLSGASDKFKEKLQIPLNAKAEEFTYLASGVKVIEGISDSEMYTRLEEAFGIMGFTKSQIEDIMTAVASVLHLGQIKFKPTSTDQGSVVDMVAVERSCKLLGVKPDEFIKSVLQPRVKIGREFSTQSRTAAQAQHTINAVSKALYERLFGYIVDQLNARLGTENSGSCIGVLDIAGFEIFEHNSFEQLCINYTNEKLQQFFNHHMFVLEQEEYVKEEVDWNYVDYGADLQPTIDLIEKMKSPMGIFSCLNEESMLASGSDESFNDKLINQWEGSNTKFSQSRLGRGFKIDHYAQTVEYSTDGWIEKNKDPLSDSVELVLSNSSSILIRSLFTPKDGTKTKAKSLFRTVAQRHKEQLNDLMIHLEATHPHFVRCILPNTSRSPSSFNNRLVLDQLRYNGVLEGIRIARSGYPNRMEFAEFSQRYRPLAGATSGPLGTQQTCATILQRIKLDDSRYKVGLTKVFFRNGVLADLEYQLEKLIEEQTLAVQTFSRGALCRISFKAALHRRQAGKVLAKAFNLNIKNANDPWWHLAVRLRPLLQSKESMDNGKKDMRMQKLEASLHRLKEEQIELMSNKNELRGELIAALKTKEELAKLLQQVKNSKIEQEEAHNLAITSAVSRDEASRNALEEISKSHSALNDKYNELVSAHSLIESEWKSKMDQEINDRVKEAANKYSLLENELITAQRKYSSEIKSLKKDADSTKQSLAQQIEVHKKELVDIETEKQGLLQRHADIATTHETEKTSLQKEVEDSKIKLSESEKLYSKQAQEFQDCKTQAKQKDTKLNDVTKELEKVREKLVQTEGNLKDSLLAKKELDDLKEQHKTTVTDFENKLRKSVGPDELSKVASENARLRKDLDLATDNLLKLNEEMSKLKDSSENAKANLTLQVNQSKEELVYMKAELEKSRSLAKSLRITCESSKAEMTGASKKITELRLQLNELKEQNAELNSSLSSSSTSLLESQNKVSDLTALLTSRKGNAVSPNASVDFDNNKKMAELRMELAETQKALLKYKAQTSSSDRGFTVPYSKKFSNDDAEHELTMVRHDLSISEARNRELEADLDSAKKANAQAIILRQRYEKLQREKAALAQDRSQLLLTAKNSRSQSRELEIAKAQAADVKRMKSEITVLQVKLARSEKALREMSAELSNAKIHTDSNNNSSSKETESMRQRMRAAEIANFQFARTVRELRNPRTSHQVRPDNVLRNPSDSGEPVDPNDPPLDISKRGMPQALQNISNDRRVSEQAHVAAENVKSTSFEEVVDVYKRRAAEFHTKLEKAELVVQTALRGEKTAKQEVAELKSRLQRIEDDHDEELTTIRSKMIEARRVADERNSVIEKLKSGKSENFEWRDQMRSVNGSLKDISAERDQLMRDKSVLEKRLQDLVSSLSQKPNKLHNQVLEMKEAEQQMIREQGELRWNLERKDRLLDTLRRNLSGADARYEQCRSQIDRLQANEASREIVLRRAAREVAEAKERYLLVERELQEYRMSSASIAAEKEKTPAFI